MVWPNPPDPARRSADITFFARRTRCISLTDPRFRAIRAEAGDAWMEMIVKKAIFHYFSLCNSQVAEEDDWQPFIGAPGHACNTLDLRDRDPDGNLGRCLGRR
jgi:hypothetical protein